MITITTADGGGVAASLQPADGGASPSTPAISINISPLAYKSFDSQRNQKLYKLKLKGRSHTRTMSPLLKASRSTT